jgi:3-hydroxyacyl-CoA dehydrogenase/enoyl-CoA hydratase/3-hydroxybutyryl-CoA epimerase
MTTIVFRDNLTSRKPASRRMSNKSPRLESRIVANPVPSEANDSRTICREVDADGICHLVFDAPDSSANVFNRETLLEFERHIAWLETASHVRGVVLRSAKPRIFIAGADLKSMMNASALEIEEMVELGQRIFTSLKRLPMPKVAAIHGACLGGGCELTLTCDWRIASDDPVTKIGLPETQLGLVPAWGGCTRLPRRIGVRRATEVILKGSPLTARAARKCGLVDDVVPLHCLVKHAKEWIARRPERRGRPHFNSVAAPFVWMVARRRLKRQTHGNYPALYKALKLVCRSPYRTTAQSLAAERDEFERLVHHADTRNLVRLFFARERARKLRVAGSPQAVQRVAVIGAGVMGTGIAYWLSTRGFPVLLADVNDDALAKAAKRLHAAYDEARRRRLLTDNQVQRGLDRVTLAVNTVPLRSADLIIEAAVEDADVKRRLFADIVDRARPDAVLATNTSAIPIGSLLDEPRIVGLHFFNPVHAMPLVEVVRPAKASDDAIATAVQFVQAIGKLPVVVKDSPGFLVNRILMPYLLDAARLVREGGGARLIDHAMLDYGMPMGPLRLLDEVGLDVALHVAKTLSATFPMQATVPSYLDDWVKAGRLGRKSGEGFYRYNGGGPTPAVAGSYLGDIEDVTRRLSLLLTNEAVRCLDEEIVATPGDVDLGMVLGTGYAPFRGGPLRHADESGLALVVGQLHHLEHDHGPLFTPARGLVERAENGKAFYPKEEDHENSNACEI